jgi:hypothetical protein
MDHSSAFPREFAVIYSIPDIQKLMHINVYWCIMQHNPDERAQALTLRRLEKKFYDTSGLKITHRDLELYQPSSGLAAARWRPESKSALLKGGPGDGKMYSADCVGTTRPLIIASYEDMKMHKYTSEKMYPETELGIKQTEYIAMGWDSSMRAWIYAPR